MILDKIVKEKKKEIKKLKIGPSGLKPSKIDFKAAITSKPLGLIAEIKKASPSAGIIREGIDVKEIAGTYSKYAQAISVITDKKFFNGSIDFISEAKKVTKLPILRKDFIIDKKQVYESRLYGADAILLIASILSGKEIDGLIAIAKRYKMGCLVEVHTEKELEMVLKTKAEMIGINNRDLKTFKVDINTTLKLAKDIPDDRVVVCESGLNTKKDIDLLRGKVDAVLIGTAFMSSPDIEKKIKELIG